MTDNDKTELLVPLHTDQYKGIFGRIQRYSVNLRQYYFLYLQLIKVDMTTSYKRSFLGLTWLVLTPIFSVIVWVLLNGAGIFDPGDTGIPYPAYVLLSTSVWTFFQGSYQVTSNILINSGRFMVTARFPHIVLVIEQMTVHCINFIIPFLINLVVLLFYGVKFNAIALLFPVTLIPLLLCGTGLGLVVGLFRVVAIDFSKLADQAIFFLMFLTPIVYSSKLNMGWFSDIVKMNPMTYLVGFSRDVLTRGEFYHPEIYMALFAGSFIFFYICLTVFMKSEEKLLERLINV